MHNNMIYTVCIVLEHVLQLYCFMEWYLTVDLWGEVEIFLPRPGNTAVLFQGEKYNLVLYSLFIGQQGHTGAGPLRPVNFLTQFSFLKNWRGEFPLPVKNRPQVRFLIRVGPTNFFTIFYNIMFLVGKIAVSQLITIFYIPPFYSKWIQKTSVLLYLLPPLFVALYTGPFDVPRSDGNPEVTTFIGLQYL